MVYSRFVKKFYLNLSNSVNNNPFAGMMIIVAVVGSIPVVLYKAGYSAGRLVYLIMN